MTYENIKRNKKTESNRVAKANQPREQYRQARRQHIREMARLIREVYRQYLMIRKAKLIYRLEKR